MNVLYALVVDIKDNSKLFNNTHVFDLNISEELICPQLMLTEMQLPDFNSWKTLLEAS